jgi:hypothetical protein
MNAENRVNDYFEELLEEHRELLKQIQEIRQWWNECDELGRPKWNEMGARINDLHDRLVAHFADEEEGGYLSSALELAPRFNDEAARLQRQHADFLKTLESISKTLHARDPQISWNEARDEFEAFVTDLARHESAEKTILQSAFDDDVGAAD